jgi:TorA maturation chaperone TorD
MNVASTVLWPEPDHKNAIEIDDAEAARAREYSLLATLLARSPDAAMLRRIAKLRGDETPLGQAHLALALAASRTNAQVVEREFFDLFIGVGRGELLPYGSYYLTGFLNERPLARLREDFRAAGVERVEGQLEPEDHAATLCEVMAGFAGGQFAITLVQQKLFFERHLAPWLGQFFVDLGRTQAAEFYRHVAEIGRLFIEAEAEAFAFPK